MCWLTNLCDASVMINSQCVAFAPTLCLQTSLKSTTVLPYGRRDVVNVIELPAPGLKRGSMNQHNCLTATALNLCQASMLEHTMKLSKEDSLIVGIIYFSLFV